MLRGREAPLRGMNSSDVILNQGKSRLNNRKFVLVKNSADSIHGPYRIMSILVCVLLPLKWLKSAIKNLLFLHAFKMQAQNNNNNKNMHKEPFFSA